MNPRFVCERLCRSAWRPGGLVFDRLSKVSGIYQTRRYSSTANKSQRIPFGRLAFSTLLISAIATAAIEGWFYNRRVAREVEITNPTRPQYATESELRTALAQIQDVVGENAVTEEFEELHRHGFSDWSFKNAERLPAAVVFPKSTEEVAAVAKICNKYRVPLTPYSAGSSLEGNFSSPVGGITMDFAYMNNIIALHADDMDVAVQPGVPWMKLNNEIKEHGLFFPVDPGPTAQIGGMVATGGSGTNTVRYGTMRDWVINLTVVLADGTIVKTRKRPRKSAAGYNLTQLFIGSEGTLGIVTEITLKLAVIPEETSVAVAAFPSIRAAASAAIGIMRQGVPIAAMEIMDETQINLVNEFGATDRKWKEVPTIFFKFSGTEAGVNDNIKRVKDIAISKGCQTFEFASTEQEKESLWSARKQALWSAQGMKKHEFDAFWGTDVAVPLSRTPDLIEMTKGDLTSLGLFGAALGHIGDGNFHISLIYRTDLADERQKAENFVHQMVERALELDGTCTGEHGVGIGKKKELIDELGIDTVNVMKMIKKTLDPNWILNPGKIFDF